jgi:vancomycin resistance protein YoaR
MSLRFLRILLVVVFTVIALTLGIITAFLTSDTIYHGVKVEGINLGGQNRQEAEKLVASALRANLNKKISLIYKSQTWTSSIAELGGKIDTRATVQKAYDIGRKGSFVYRIGNIIRAWQGHIDIAPVYSFCEDNLRNKLRQIARSIDQEPINARLVLDKGSIRAIPEKTGVKLDINRSQKSVVEAINNGHYTAELVVEFIQPTIRTTDFAGITGILASYSTKYKPWQRDRTHNLILAAEALNGTLLKPGETFSYNKVVGPRKPSRGFRKAPIFVRGEVEQGLGGGVCQVSTTVYNAALLANMEILSRAHHSRPVDYAPIGRDATVAYPAPDLKFRNTTGAPVYILASASNGIVSVILLGKKPSNQEVQLISDEYRIIYPRTLKTVDKSLLPGQKIVRSEGRPGYRIKIYRIVKQQGKVVKKELISDDYYRPEDRIIAIAESNDFSESAKEGY